jgi:hypothetical protein
VLPTELFKEFKLLSGSRSILSLSMTLRVKPFFIKRGFYNCIHNLASEAWREIGSLNAASLKRAYGFIESESAIVQLFNFSLYS